MGVGLVPLREISNWLGPLGSRVSQRQRICILIHRSSFHSHLSLHCRRYLSHRSDSRHGANAIRPHRRCDCIRRSAGAIRPSTRTHQVRITSTSQAGRQGGREGCTDRIADGWASGCTERRSAPSPSLPPSVCLSVARRLLSVSWSSGIWLPTGTSTSRPSWRNI